MLMVFLNMFFPKGSTSKPASGETKSNKRKIATPSSPTDDDGILIYILKKYIYVLFVNNSLFLLFSKVVKLIHNVC